MSDFKFKVRAIPRSATHISAGDFSPSKNISGMKEEFLDKSMSAVWRRVFIGDLLIGRENYQDVHTSQVEGRTGLKT